MSRLFPTGLRGARSSPDSAVMSRHICKSGQGKGKVLPGKRIFLSTQLTILPGDETGQTGLRRTYELIAHIAGIQVRQTQFHTTPNAIFK